MALKNKQNYEKQLKLAEEKLKEAIRNGENVEAASFYKDKTEMKLEKAKADLDDADRQLDSAAQDLTRMNIIKERRTRRQRLKQKQLSWDDPDLELF